MINGAIHVGNDIQFTTSPCCNYTVPFANEKTSLLDGDSDGESDIVQLIEELLDSMRERFGGGLLSRSPLASSRSAI